MKALATMEAKEMLHYILKSEELRDMMYDTICCSEIDYAREQLDCFPSGSIDWEISTTSPSYLDIKDEEGFLAGAEESARIFGASTKREKLTNHARNLEGTNLFHHYIDLLKEAVYDDIIGCIVNYLDDISSAIYNEDEDNSYLIEEIDNRCFEYRVEDIYVTNDERLVKLEELR